AEAGEVAYRSGVERCGLGQVAGGVIAVVSVEDVLEERLHDPYVGCYGPAAVGWRCRFRVRRNTCRRHATRGSGGEGHGQGDALPFPHGNLLLVRSRTGTVLVLLLAVTAVADPIGA